MKIVNEEQLANVLRELARLYDTNKTGSENLRIVADKLDPPDPPKREPKFPPGMLVTAENHPTSLGIVDASGQVVYLHTRDPHMAKGPWIPARRAHVEDWTREYSATAAGTILKWARLWGIAAAQETPEQ